MRTMKTGDFIALGLAALVVAGVYTQRIAVVVEPEPKRPLDPLPPDLNDPHVVEALKTIAAIENNPALPPATAAAVLDQAAALPGMSPQAVALLKAAADKQRARLGPTPTPPAPQPGPGPAADPLLIKYNQLMTKGQTTPDAIDDATLAEMDSTVIALATSGRSQESAMLLKLASDIRLRKLAPRP